MELQSPYYITNFKNSIKLSFKKKKNSIKLYKSHDVFNYNLYRLSKNTLILKKLLIFIDIKLLITLNEFFYMNINTHFSKFFCIFMKES